MYWTWAKKKRNECIDCKWSSMEGKKAIWKQFHLLGILEWHTKKCFYCLNVHRAKNTKCIRASRRDFAHTKFMKKWVRKNLKFILRTTQTCISHVAINMTRSWTYFNELSSLCEWNFIYIKSKYAHKKTLKIDTIDLALIVRVVNKNSKSSYTYIQRSVIDLIVTPINQKLKSNVFAVKFI